MADGTGRPSQFPRIAHRPIQQAIGFVVVGEGLMGGVPLQLPAQLDRYVLQVAHRVRIECDIDRCRRRRLPFHGINEIHVVIVALEQVKLIGPSFGLEQ